MLLVPQTAAVASNVILLGFGFLFFVLLGSLLTGLFSSFFAFCRNFPKTPTKCGGFYYRLSRGCTARPSDRIVKTRGAPGGHPLDRAPGGALDS